MTSEDDVRLRVLSKLLADERDPEKVKVLAVEAKMAKLLL